MHNLVFMPGASKENNKPGTGSTTPDTILIGGHSKTIRNIYILQKNF